MWGVFGTLLSADFLRWDDYQVIVLNPVVTRGLFRVIWSDPLDMLYIPVTYSFWALLWKASAGQPWLFHAANIALHSINTLLVLRIGTRLAGSDSARRMSAAVLGAAMFALHPLQVEPVAWVTCGRDLLAAACALGTLAILLDGDSPQRLVVATAVFVFGLLSKPTIAVAPIGFAAIILAAGLGSRRRLTALGLWLVPAVGAVLVNKAIQQQAADLRRVAVSLPERAWVVCDSLAFYAAKLVWPHPLAADYGRTPSRALATFPSPLGLGILTVSSVLVMRELLRGRRVLPGLVAAALIFSAPTLGVVPFQAQGISTVADRYAYLAIACIAWIIAVVMATAPPLTLVPATAAACLMASLTFARLPVWQTNDEFFTDMVAKNPASLGGLTSLAVERLRQDRIDEAESLYRDALRIDPLDVHAVAGLIDIRISRGAFVEAANEFLPLFADKAFLTHNELDAMPLAHAYRLAARLCWHEHDWQQANDFYCRSFAIYFDSGERQAELRAFLADADQHGVELKLDPKYATPRHRPRPGDGWKRILW